MWDCAQKKALEKIFNLVTNKSCLKGAKGAKMSNRKTCVFFNSGSKGRFEPSRGRFEVWKGLKGDKVL